ncbi:MAG: DUF2061 domain-containing protein [Candidatus Thermoplasmatota archaeon]
MKEGKKRTIAKSISYRIICIISLALVTYIFTGNILQMTSIVVVFQTIQTVIYYFHERAWEIIKWGHA